ncbi:MAG TPA: efflux RND transporter periplasmic adaptor subunit, partial [Gemmatimonadales bacterium]|nr:efflux RND transporter periplasmic adaptor subunit [Gemmatimonadales bacterium]
QLEASVPAEQLADLKVGTTVRFTVNGLPDTTFTGKIERINPTADPATRQVTLYATIPNAAHRLVGGLFAQGQVTVERRPALLIPVSAVDQRGVTPTVLRLKQGKAEQAAVALGARDTQHGRIEITSGLAAGDTVLVGNAQGVSPGTPVRVTVLKDQTAAER